ncbi:MAG TPA: hypothetical protein VFQ53_43335 [Kofleriaceae bacterium]|nr:hypothetical protein [Kofleriaceae bacterium]
MDALAGLLVLAAVVAAAVWMIHRHERERATRADAALAGARQHRRSGDYPSSCSWCKNTALARKLFVFERVDGIWTPCDVLARLQACPDAEVDAVAQAFASHQLQFRRFCSERCTNDFFAAANLTVPDAFSTCDYCSARSPSTPLRCPNCGAPRLARHAAGAK